MDIYEKARVAVKRLFLKGIGSMALKHSKNF
jgi:hypothetical protein